MRHRRRGARGLVRLSSMRVALASLLSPPFAAPQAPPRTARIGYLGGGSPSTAFVEGLRTRGWVAGRNLAVDYGWAEGSPDRMVGLGRELTRRKPEVIVVNSAVDILSYGPSEADLQQRLATLVDRILRGARPGDLPVEQPTRFELAINLKTAKTLGLTVPPSLLVRADPT